MNWRKGKGDEMTQTGEVKVGQRNRVHKKSNGEQQEGSVLAERESMPDVADQIR